MRKDTCLILHTTFSVEVSLSDSSPLPLPFSSSSSSSSSCIVVKSSELSFGASTSLALSRIATIIGVTHIFVTNVYPGNRSFFLNFCADLSQNLAVVYPPQLGLLVEQFHSRE